MLGYIDKGVEEGAELVVDGRGFKLQGYENGFFVGGSLFDRVTPDMTHLQGRDFRAGALGACARRATSTPSTSSTRHEYGNGTAIFTRDGDAARDFADKIEVGMVGINVPIPVPVAYHSFGGWKRSLFGDHAIYGPEGVHFYTRLKTVTTRWPAGIAHGAVFNFPSHEIDIHGDGQGSPPHRPVARGHERRRRISIAPPSRSCASTRRSPLTAKPPSPQTHAGRAGAEMPDGAGGFHADCQCLGRSGLDHRHAFGARHRRMRARARNGLAARQGACPEKAPPLAAAGIRVGAEFHFPGLK